MLGRGGGVCRAREREDSKDSGGSENFVGGEGRRVRQPLDCPSKIRAGDGVRGGTFFCGARYERISSVC